MTHHWGIDVGGTKIEGVILESSRSIEPLARVRVDTEQEGGFEHVVSQVGKVVELLKKESKREPKIIGVGVPGVIEPKTRKVKNGNIVCLANTPFRDAIAEYTKVETLLANDANCFALAEATLGAGRDGFSVLGLILGTGCGSGIVIDKKVFRGLHGMAGEWGHNPLEPGGRPWYDGIDGCVESVISGKGLELHYEERAGKKMRMPDIYKAALAGDDQHAVETLDRLVVYFGKALGAMINILDPDVIVIGGGVSNIKELYTRGREEVIKNVYNDHMNTKIVQNELGDSAGVYGACMLAAGEYKRLNANILK